MAPGGRFTVRRPASKVSANPTMTDHIAMPLVGQTSDSATPIDNTVVPFVGENSNSTTPHSTSKSKRNGRGPTHGMGLDKIMQATGRKLVIQIDPDNGRPLNAVQSAKLSFELGIIARDFMRPMTKWKEVYESQKDEVFGRLNAHFDIDLKFDHVRRCCEMLLQHRSRESRYRLHERFKTQLKDCGNVEEVRRKLPIGIEEDDWNILINMWTNPKWEERSQKNKQNRSKNKLKHNTGSKAFVVIREEMNEM